MKKMFSKSRSLSWVLRGFVPVAVCIIVTAAISDAFAQSSILDRYRSGTSSSSTSGTSGTTSGTSSSNATAGAGSAATENTGVGSLQGNERFVRENRDPGQFVGSDASDTTNAYGIEQGTGVQNNRRTNGSENTKRWQQEQQRQAQTGRAGSRAQKPFRTTLKVGFDYSPIAASDISVKLQQRLTKSTALELQQPVTVIVQQRTAILRGVVPNQRARDLAVMYARLEPGISQVVDELTLAASASGN